MAKVQLYGCADCEIAIDCENRCAEHTPPCAKLADKNFNSLQQLKAKIAVAVLGLETLSTEDFDNGGAEKFIGLLRQLSAV